MHLDLLRATNYAVSPSSLVKTHENCTSARMQKTETDLEDLSFTTQAPAMNIAQELQYFKMQCGKKLEVRESV